MSINNLTDTQWNAIFHRLEREQQNWYTEEEYAKALRKTRIARDCSERGIATGHAILILKEMRDTIAGGTLV